jgi:hypothetical protein
MESKTFVIEKYGNKKEFVIGQKVECIYYHEYGRWYMKDAYKRKWWQLFDLPFKPVKLGVIVGDAGVHPYWLAGNDRKEQYLFVKFKEYFFAKPIPISCIQDALQAAERTLAMLERDKDKIGQKGYGQDAFDSLSKQANRALQFVGK